MSFFKGSTKIFTLVKFLLLGLKGNLYTYLFLFVNKAPFNCVFSSFQSDSCSTPYPILRINLVSELPLFTTEILSGVIYNFDNTKQFPLIFSLYPVP